MKIALFVNGEFGLSVLECFSAQDNIEIVCINYYLAQAVDRERYYQSLAHAERWNRILRHCFSLVSDEQSIHSKKLIENLKQKNVDWIILCGWPEIIQPDFLDCFREKIINIHPSLLPYYKGPNPYFAVINQGEVQTGFTLHQVTSEIDSGPILYQSQPIEIDQDNETGLSLQQKIASSFQLQIQDILQALSLPQFTEQLNSGSWVKLPKPPFVMDWQLPPELISQQTRAMYPWGTFKTQLCGFTFLLGPGYVKRETHSHSSEPGQLLSYSLTAGAVFSSIRDNQVIIFPHIQLKGYPQWVFWILKLLLLRKQKVSLSQ